MNSIDSVILVDDSQYLDLNNLYVTLLSDATKIEQYCNIANKYGMSKGLEYIVTDVIGVEGITDTIKAFSEKIAEYIKKAIEYISNFFKRIWDWLYDRGTRWKQKLKDYSTTTIHTAKNFKPTRDSFKNDPAVAKAIEEYEQFISRKIVIMDKDTLESIYPDLKTAISIINNVGLANRASELLNKCKSIKDLDQLKAECAKIAGLPEYIFAFQSKLAKVNLVVDKTKVTINTAEFKTVSGTLLSLGLIKKINDPTSAHVVSARYTATVSSLDMEQQYSDLLGKMDYIKKEQEGLKSFERDYRDFLKSDIGKRLADMEVQKDIMTGIKFIVDFITQSANIFKLCLDSLFAHGSVQLELNNKWNNVANHYNTWYKKAHATNK